MKKVIAIALSVLIIISALPMAAFAVQSDEVHAKMEAARDYLYGSKESFTAEDGYDFALFLAAGGNGAPYKDAYIQSVKDAFDAGSMNTADKIAFAALCLNKLGEDTSAFTLNDNSTVNLVQAMKESGTVVDSPYYYHFVLALSDDDAYTASILTVLKNDYTMGSGYNYWGFASDNTANFGAIMAKYADESDYLHDVDSLLEGYKVEKGYYYNANYGTDANGNSTASVLFYYATIGNNDKADETYSLLVDNFGVAGGAYAYELGGEDNAYATRDALKALIAYDALLDNSSSGGDQSQAYGSYYVRITYTITRTGKFNAAYGGFNVSVEDTAGISLLYKSSSDTQTYAEVNWDLKDTMANSGTGTYTLTALVEGYPYLIYGYDNENNTFMSSTCEFNINKLEAGSSEDDLAVLWTGNIYLSSRINEFGVSVDWDGTEKTDYFGTDSDNRVANSSGGWARPDVTTPVSPIIHSINGLEAIKSYNQTAEITVTLLQSGTQVAACTTTAADGFYFDNLEPGTYDISLSAPGSLGLYYQNVIVDDAEGDPLPQGEMIFGDIDGDEMISARDLALFLGYALNQQYNALADVDGDGFLVLSDISILLSCYGKGAQRIVVGESGSGDSGYEGIGF